MGAPRPAEPSRGETNKKGGEFSAPRLSKKSQGEFERAAALSSLIIFGDMRLRTGHAESVPGVSGLWSASHCPRPFSPPLRVGPPDYGKNGIFKGANLRFAVENAFPVPPSSHSPANCADACSRVRPLRSTSCCPQGLVVASLLPPEIPQNFRRRVLSIEKR